MRQKLRADFGRFDFAIHKGQVVLFDVNVTPGGTLDLQQYREELDDFATGILALLPDRQALSSNKAGGER